MKKYPKCPALLFWNFTTAQRRWVSFQVRRRLPFIVCCFWIHFPACTFLTAELQRAWAELVQAQTSWFPHKSIRSIITFCLLPVCQWGKKLKIKNKKNAVACCLLHAIFPNIHLINKFWRPFLAPKLFILIKYFLNFLILKVLVWSFLHRKDVKFCGHCAKVLKMEKLTWKFGKDVKFYCFAVRMEWVN